MRFFATLEKVGDTKETLRTKTVDGIFEDPPEVGKRFDLLSESLTAGGFCRMISTSPVTEVLDACLPGSPLVLFKTEGCPGGVHYELTNIKEVSENEQKSTRH